MSTDNLINKRGLTVSDATVFIAGSMAGTGILSLPKAADNIESVGLLLIGLYSILSMYTAILLSEAWCMAADIFEDCKGHVQNPYQLLAQKTYGTCCRYTVSICLYICLFGSTVVLFLVIADNMENLVFDLGYHISKCSWLVIIAACLTPFTWLGTPKDFWWMAYGALATTVICVVVILIICSLDASNQPRVQHQEADFQKIILGIGITLFAYGFHPSFLTFQNDMIRQKDFKTAIILGTIIILLLYLPPSIIGYLVYGKNLNDNILNNLPNGPLYYIVAIVITLHLLLAIVPIINPVLQDVDLVFHVPTDFTWKRCVSRTIVVVCVVFVSATIPKFNSVQSVVGASAYVVLCIIFPVLFHTRMRKIHAACDDPMTDNDTMGILSGKQRNEVTPLWKKVLNYEILGIGVIVGGTASLSAIFNIVSPDSFTTPCYVNADST